VSVQLRERQQAWLLDSEMSLGLNIHRFDEVIGIVSLTLLCRRCQAVNALNLSLRFCFVFCFFFHQPKAIYRSWNRSLKVFTIVKAWVSPGVHSSGRVRIVAESVGHENVGAQTSTLQIVTTYWPTVGHYRLLLVLAFLSTIKTSFGFLPDHSCVETINQTSLSRRNSMSLK
jgi:hypothetical protein